MKWVWRWTVTSPEDLGEFVYPPSLTWGPRMFVNALPRASAMLPIRTGQERSFRQTRASTDPRPSISVPASAGTATQCGPEGHGFGPYRRRVVGIVAAPDRGGVERKGHPNRTRGALERRSGARAGAVVQPVRRARAVSATYQIQEHRFHDSQGLAGGLLGSWLRGESSRAPGNSRQ